MAQDRFAFEKAEMGLPVRVTLHARDESQARAGADAAFARIEALNAIFTDYDSDSELSRLSDSSGQGRAVPVSEEMWKILEFAQHVSTLSDGAFDMSVGPLVNLWRVARKKKMLPNPERLAEAMARVGFRSIRLDADSHSVELLKPRMRLDAGGIAKGYAMEEALKVLQKLGFPQSMVVGGGDIALGDAPPGEKGWRVQLTALDLVDAPKSISLTLANCSVSTSGDLFQRLEIDGKRYSHIVDPRTGVGLTDHSLVTVISKSGLEADALSKVIAVLGPDRGLQLLEVFPEVAVRVLRPASASQSPPVEERCNASWTRILSSQPATR